MTVTPLTTVEATAVIDSVFRQVIGRSPGRCELNILTTQSALETANWGTLTGGGFHNFNFANLIKGRSGHRFFVQRVPEFIDGRQVMVNQKFRSYEAATAGAADWLKQLMRNWPTALEAARDCNVDEFVRRLKHEGRIGAFFTAPLSRYQRGMRLRANSLGLAV